MSISVGWSRGTWNSGRWNLSPDVAVDVTGLQIEPNINFGNGWSREEWNVGAWNEAVGNVVTGDGVVFVEDGQGLSSSVNNVTVTGNAPFSITGEQLNISQGEETVIALANVTITSADLLTATVNTFAVTANGAITISTPTFEANVELNNDGLNVGLATFLNVTGQALTASAGDVIANSENFISITTAGQVSTTVNSISLSTVNIIDITGNSLTTSSANIIPNSQNFLSIIGNQANVNVTTLKFWDPIEPTIIEEWTNIH